MPYLYVTIMIALLDQVLKWLVQTKMYPWQSIELWKGIVSLTYARNPGAAFNILQSQPALLAVIAAGIFVLVWLNRREVSDYPWTFQIGIAIALGGALGNFVDRVRLGYVVDFIDFHFWPVFNLADTAIVGGVGLIILGFLFKSSTEKLKRLQPDQNR